MQATESGRFVWLAMLGAAQAFAFKLVMAAPPGAAAQNQPAKPTFTQKPAAFAAQLDLRAPSRAMSRDEPQSFPSAIVHRQFGGVEQSPPLPSLGAGNPRIRPPLADLARHIQHEGLPLARLWENKSALLHIGLNQRGKPGLWLVQKVP